MLYTRAGDNGTTRTFGCGQRISKSSKIAEALGTLDETNSFLGVCKVESEKEKLFFQSEVSFATILEKAQGNLFIVQAELAGSKMSITPEKIIEMEAIIDGVEKELPPIKSFFISGGTKLAALFDYARTISRRAERRVVEASEEGKTEVGENTLAYLNRLSSLLYVLARLTNHKFGITESGPTYK